MFFITMDHLFEDDRKKDREALEKEMKKVEEERKEKERKKAEEERKSIASFAKRSRNIGKLYLE